MLRSITEEEFNHQIEWAYQLALDITKTGFPIYMDGLKKKEDFIDRSHQYQRENEDILLFLYDGKITGWIHYYYFPEDHYMDTATFLVEHHFEEAMSEFLEFANQNFKGYELYLGFPYENIAAITYFRERKIPLIDDSFETIYGTVGSREDESSADVLLNTEAIQQITLENYDDFKVLHDHVSEDMYWNSERMKDALDQWEIFVLKDIGIPQAAIYYRSYHIFTEIFGMDYSNHLFQPEQCRKLISFVQRKIAETYHNPIVYFVDNHEELACLLRQGFQKVCRYQCYKYSIR